MKKERSVIFEFEKGNDGRWFWRCKGGNGEVSCHAQGYASKSNAVRAVRTLTKKIFTGKFEIQTK